MNNYNELNLHFAYIYKFYYISGTQEQYLVIGYSVGLYSFKPLIVALISAL
jgi:hypothetical protein